MSVYDIGTGLQSLRGTDSNSLLRFLDSAHLILQRSASQGGRERANKTIQRITKELRKRQVSPQT